MARLCRVHLTGVGEACARFHPLTLDFRHAKTGLAQDSIIWLRNGGGKTTVISLLYSILVPNQNQFLGRLLGKDTTLTDFLRPNEIGVVVGEWDFPALQTLRRVVGQVARLKDRDLKRYFFSYYAIPGFGFDQLPVLGLGTPARSIEAFLDNLREAERRHGAAMDLVITENQHEWEKHLDERGLDPFLFRLHLKMNKQEGGASDLFKLKCPEDFLRLFLELVFDERTTEELEKSLIELRSKIARAPDRLAAISFGDELLKSLRPFAQEAAERTRLREERKKLKQEMAALAAAIRNFLDALKQQATIHEKAQLLFQDNVAELDRQRLLHVRYKGGYERLGRELRVHESEVAWVTAKEAETLARRRQSLLEAAVAWLALVQKEAELKGCLAQLESLRLEHRPELEALRALGAALMAAFQTQIHGLGSAQMEAEGKLKEAKSALRVLNAERADLRAKQAAAEASRDEANSALTRHDEARRRLREDEFLNPTETGKAALVRWEQEAGGLAATVDQLRGEAETIKLDLAEKKSERQEDEKQRQQREGELKAARGRLADAEKQQNQVADLPTVRELCEGAKPDLRNPHLIAQLEAISEAAQARLVELGIADAEDHRSLHNLEREGLFAPSLDVSEVVRHLHDAGLRSALPVYRWLAEHRTAAEALDVLRRHPSAYAGILLQNPLELVKARATVQALNIKTPVMLLTPESLPATAQFDEAGRHTVLPTEHGMFSTKEAALARPQLEQRRETRETERDSATIQRKQAHDAARLVRDFNQIWPPNRITELTLKAVACEQELNFFTEKIAGLKAHLSDLEGCQQANQAAQLTCATKLATVKGHARQLKTFVSEHENHAERWKSQRESSVKNLADFGQNLRLLDEEEPRLDEMERSANARRHELDIAISNARRACNDLPSEYVGEPSTGLPSQQPAELEPEFRHAIAVYEGKVQKGPLEGRIQELQRVANGQREGYERLRDKPPHAEIEAVARLPALEAELDTQKQVVVDAYAAQVNAKRDFDTAKAHRPDAREFKAGTDTNDSLFQRPRTSQECAELTALLQLKIEELASKLDTTKEQLEKVGHSLVKVQAREPLYKSLLDRVQKGDGVIVAPHASFSENDESNQTLVTRLCRDCDETERALVKVEDALRRRFDKEMHPLIFGDRFAKRNIPFRERLQRLGSEDFAMQAEQQIRAVEEQVTVCRAELDAQQQEQNILIQKLDTLSRQTANLFEQAARVSELPDMMGAWARQPFLRITLPRKNDPAERQVLLGLAVNRWFEAGQSIPRGYELAFECLIALCGTKSTNIRILKPEYQLRAGSYDIMELVKFSDGEKLTTAIVLYCILVRLRARQKARAEHLLGTDAGLLLLDNPFGKATLATFVDLQLRMARLMGVQLIYATGINDFSALKHFPHYVRLRNSSRGKMTNDYHVTADPRPLQDECVEGVRLGFERDGNTKSQ